MGNLQTALRELIDNPTTHEVHSMAPWWIARAKPNAHQVAKRSLMREGFEVWWPKAKIIRHPALSSLPSKTRHKLRHMTIESERPIFGAYIFFRRMMGNADLRRLHELLGVSGLCTSGAEILTVRDLDIEFLRLKEAQGKFDEHQTTSKFKYNARNMHNPTAMVAHIAKDMLVGRLDLEGETVLFIEALDRVTKIIAKSESRQAAPWRGTI